MKDNLYPEINESLNSSEVRNLEFKIKYTNEIQIFLIREIHELEKIGIYVNKYVIIFQLFDLKLSCSFSY